MANEHSPPPTLSLVVPMYNEEAAVASFFDKTRQVLEAAQLNYEIICVNDGSHDRTLELLRSHASEDRRLRVIDLSRNFGKEVALSAGLDFCAGDAVIPIDADLQDPPELIPDMIALWRSGYEVVLAVRRDRSADQRFKRVSARWFYRLISSVSEIPIPENAGDFRLMDRRVVNALRTMPERTRFMKGIFAWLGFRTTQIDFVRPARHEGTAKQNLRSLLRLAANGLISFTAFPLRVWTVLGLSLSALSALFLIAIILQTLFMGREVPGYASLMTVVLLFNGVVLINLGILGEYVARIFTEVKQRPLYLVRETVNLDPPGGGEPFAGPRR